MITDELGLTEIEVVKMRQKYGSNVISEKKQSNFWQLFLENLGDPIIRILLIALAIKTLFLIRSFDWYETIGIVIAILMASVISTLSERGSEASFKRLQDEASKMYCKVYRDKRLKQVFVGEVVCRDVVL
ncbi:MAG: cation-transporting P-type ATPase, partial [Bacilli bacterium]|nr:cation-transporting P-type ATPase [Bacilli bacterium]